MLHLLGTALVSSAVFLIGRMRAEALCRRSALEDAFCSLLYHIRSRTEYGGVSLNGMYESFLCKPPEQSSFFDTLFEKVGENDCFSLKSALVCEKKRLSLDSEFFALLCDFADEIGKSPTASAGCECCDRYIQLAKNHISQTRADRKRLIDVSRKLSIFAAAFCALLLM